MYRKFQKHTLQFLQCFSIFLVSTVTGGLPITGIFHLKYWKFNILGRKKIGNIKNKYHKILLALVMPLPVYKFSWQVVDINMLYDSRMWGPIKVPLHTGRLKHSFPLYRRHITGKVLYRGASRLKISNVNIWLYLWLPLQIKSDILT